MFFSIAKESKQNFPNNYQLGNLIVNTDAGWNIYKRNEWTVVYKGYTDSGNLDSLLDDILIQHEPVLSGNFCVIAHDKNSDTIKIKTDLYRSFPIYVTESEITNLEKSARTVWADSLVEITSALDVIETKFDVIGPIDNTPITVDEAIELIDNILISKAENFVRTINRPIKTFLSGGSDSLLVYSYLQRVTNSYELVKYEHIDFDYFWLNNLDSLRKNWGYSQIHHWIEPCVLTSGTPGDEFMLRSPVTGDMWFKNQDINIYELLDDPKWVSCLHHEYFKKPENLSTFRDQHVDKCDINDMTWKLCNNVVNDWQHWHLGNTLTWTPLRDLRIFKTILRLPVSEALNQMMNSQFSIRLIEKNKPGLSRLISDQKNSGNVMKNLWEFYRNSSTISGQ